MKGIVLAGGTGTRLWPATRVVSKQLLPIYDKPMIYYPISTLMLAGVREILVITTPHQKSEFVELLGNGKRLGLEITYAIQPKPEGLAQAFIIGEKFLNSEPCFMILGDNIFHGVGLGNNLKNSIPELGAHIFTYEVSNPSEYGVLEVDADGIPLNIFEKPKKFISNLAVTGLYAFDSKVSEIAKMIKPSARGEYEITSIIDVYLRSKELTYTSLTRGTAWLDTGSPHSLNDASNYIRIIEDRTGLKIGCIEEIAFQNSWITSEQLSLIVKDLGTNSYSSYLSSLIR
jgi:glucose-1-phosphate thymidylyltransferase